MAGYSLIDASELTKPATVLIEKISDAVGTLWEPTHIRRVAQAKADAAITLAESEIEIAEVQRRAARRFVEEETRRQQNMEDITRRAIENLDPDAPSENVDDDWIANFFDKCRIISDDDMQSLWSRILAGEANSPGSFSRKTVNLVADIDRESAELFRSLCRFVWQIADHPCPLVHDFMEDVYRQHGVGLYALGHLNSIGLVQISAVGGFSIERQPKSIAATYHDRQVQLRLPNDSGNVLPVGKVLFTPSGNELLRIVDTTPIDGFFEFVYDRWANESLVPPRET